MTVLPGLTSAAASFLSAGTFGHWPWILATMHFPGPLAAVCFAASDPLPQCGSFRTRGPALRHRRGPKHSCVAMGDGVLITASATRIPPASYVGKLEALV